MKKKYLLYFFAFLVFVPWLIQYVFVSPNGFFETQHELNFDNIWNLVLNFEPEYSYGNYWYSIYKWLSYLIPSFLGGVFFWKTYGILHIGILCLIWFFGFYYLIKRFFSDQLPEKYRDIIAIGIAFVYITSPTLFLYLKSSISLTVPAFVFPFQLFLLFSSIINKKKIFSLFLLMCSFVFLIHCNITTILLNICFLILFARIYFQRRYLNIFLSVILASLPSLFFIVSLLFISMSFSYTPDGGVMETIKEDFYSNQTSIFHILKQTSDWWFFWSSETSLYYDFSLFYRQDFVEILGFLFAWGLLLFPLFSKLGRAKAYFVIVLFLIAIMLWNKFFVYDFLYHTFTPFQIFRNISKFGPFFLFALLLYPLFLLNSKKKIFIYFVLLGLGAFYNLPYYIYSDFFVKHRTVSSVSDDWKDTIRFINQNIPQSAKMLYAPAVYINELYKFESWEYNVWIMLDKFTKIKGYRLSPLLNGDYFMQKEMEKLFIPAKTINRKKVDLNLISPFMDKFHISYLLVTKDVVQNYESAQEYIDFLFLNDDFGLLYQNDSHFLFYKKGIKHHSSLIWENVSYIKRWFLTFDVQYRFSWTTNLFFLEAFNPLWNLSLLPYRSQNCNKNQVYTGEFFDSFLFSLDGVGVGQRYFVKECFSDDSFSFFKVMQDWKTLASFQKSHLLAYDYANQRTIDANYIKENFSKEYYREYDDGTIDINFILYFKPQLYLYYICWITLILFLVFPVLLVFDQRNKKSFLS